MVGASKFLEDPRILKIGVTQRMRNVFEAYEKNRVSTFSDETNVKTYILLGLTIVTSSESYNATASVDGARSFRTMLATQP